MSYNLEKTGAQVDQDLKEGLDNQPKSNVAWDDLVGSLIARRLESTAGKLQYNYDENAIEMQSGGDISDNTDRLIFNFQKPHAMSNTAPNNTMNLHIHWEQPNATIREFTVQYRVQENGQPKNTTWTTVVVLADNTNNAFIYTTGTANQITRLVDIDLSSYALSSTVQFRLARTDNETGDILATFVDAHIPYDQLGSRQEFVK
jgi:hypothetical protein